MITNAELLPLCTKRWGALSLSEQNAFLNAAFYDIDVRVLGGEVGAYVDSQGNSLPQVTSVDAILLLERRLSDSDRALYIDYISSKVSGRVYGSKTQDDIVEDSSNIAREFYFGLLNCTFMSRGEALHSVFIESNSNSLKRLATELGEGGKLGEVP